MELRNIISSRTLLICVVGIVYGVVTVEGEGFMDLIRSTRATPPLAKTQNPVCRKAKMLHSDILKNASLEGSLRAGNFSFLGEVKTMEECMGMCCANKKCQLAYMDKSKCYGVKCYNDDLCKVTSGTATDDVQISLMVKNDINRKAYVMAYIVVVVVAFGAAVSGTVWAVFIFVKRYKDNPMALNKSSKKDEDEEEEKGEAKVY